MGQQAMPRPKKQAQQFRSNSLTNKKDFIEGVQNVGNVSQPI